MIAPLLIIKRVANRSALTSDVITTGHIISIDVGSRWEPAGGGRALPAVYPMSSADDYGKDIREPGVHEVESTIEFHLDTEH